MTTLSCYNFDVREPIFIIFNRIASQKVNDQKYFVFPPHLTSASAVPGETQKHNIASFTQMLLYCIARLQPVAGLIYSVLLLATHTFLPCHSLKLVAGGMKLWTFTAT